MGKFEDIVKWGLIAVVVYLVLSFIREAGYGLAWAIQQLPEWLKPFFQWLQPPKVPPPKLTLPPIPEPWRGKEEERWLKSGLPEKTVLAIEEYTKGEPEGLKRYWLIQARRWYHYEQLLKGRKPTVEEAHQALMRIRVPGERTIIGRRLV